MNNRIKYVFCCLLLVFSKSILAQQNTILIIADDLSPDYLGCFSSTTDTAVSPNIRALAERGITFSKVWSAPVCSPARAGIFTGRYPFRTGVGTVITTAASAQLDTAEKSLARLLKYDAPTKYNTANVGKWHLHVASPQQLLFPNAMGYDFYSGNFNGALTSYTNWVRIKNGVLDTVTSYATTQVINDAISWMDTMNSSKPFFLWLAFNAPHSPFHLPPATLCDTTGLSGTTVDISAHPEKYFKAAIQAMDTEMGRLFAYLQNHNLMDSTNIIFIGDNGNESKVAQIANHNKAKATIYDYGVRVPMIVAGPAVVGQSRNSDALINTPDLFATIAELCDFPNWKNFIPTSTMIDSKSFLPIIKNQSGNDRTWIFTEQFNNPGIAADGKTIRNQDYHLLRFVNGNVEFYNQTLDAEENNNLLTNTSTMTAIDISNYHFLCDSITALTGVGTCLPLSTDVSLETNPIQVYPNPVTNSITVQCSNQAILEISLINNVGQEIGKSNGNSMDVSRIANGLYMLQIKTTKGRVIQKVSVQK